MLAVLLVCCGKPAEKTALAPDTTKQTTSELVVRVATPVEFRAALTQAFSAYLKLKDALVASDAKLAQAEAGVASSAITALQSEKNLSGAELEDWKNLATRLATRTTEIAATSDLEAQRTAFSELTASWFTVLTKYGLEGKTAYYEYCPMAFNNQGAYWFSDTSAIRNPYFGDRMLTCGSVEATLN